MYVHVECVCAHVVHVVCVCACEVCVCACGVCVCVHVVCVCVHVVCVCACGVCVCACGVCVCACGVCVWEGVHVQSSDNTTIQHMSPASPIFSGTSPSLQCRLRMSTVRAHEHSKGA